MSFDLFEYNQVGIKKVLETNESALEKTKALAAFLGSNCLPAYLINYMQNFLPAGDESIAIHSPRSIAGYADKVGEIDKATITRTKGFIGERELEPAKYPNAIHHINILFNDLGKARVFYKYQGNIRFLRTSKSNDQ